MTTLQEKVDAMQKNSATSSEAKDSDEEMESSSGNLVELSETTRTFLEAAFSAIMPNEDCKKRVGRVGIPDCDQVRCPKLDGVLKAVLPKDAIKADGYLSRLQQFWLDAVAPLAAFTVRERRSRGIDARKGGFSHPDCPIFDGECTSANGTGAEEEADSKTKSFIEVHG